MLELESKMILCPGYHIYSFQYVLGQNKSFLMVKTLSFPIFSIENEPQEMGSCTDPVEILLIFSPEY